MLPPAKKKKKKAGKPGGGLPGRTVAVLDHEAGTGAEEEPPAALLGKKATKRRKPAGGGFRIQPHDLPKGAKVRLLPHVVTKGGVISGISFGRTRTPSPFGRRMGDHTVAWAGVVDSLHAVLHGRSVRDAVEVLAARQKRAEGWMAADGSPGMRLWHMLDAADQAARKDVLEHYAHRIGTLLAEADTALKAPETAGRAAEKLAGAVAHHLAFLNYLPFATVPAKGGAGSTTSGEGPARAAVIEVELMAEERRGFDAAAVERAGRGLWTLFSMDAAVREANVDRVVAPQLTRTHVEEMEKVGDLAARSRELLRVFALPEPGDGAAAVRKRRASAPNLGAGLKAFTDELDDLEVRGRKHAAADFGHPELRELSMEIVSAVGLMRTALTEMTVKDARTLAGYRDTLGGKSAELTGLTGFLTEDAATARESAALLLAHLLYDHQTAMAEAYPHAVTSSRFLGDDPAKTAAGMVGEYIGEKVEGAESEAVDELVKRITELHATLGPAPAPAAGSRWVADSRTESLVVSFDENEVNVQGRAAAPYGVGGMGSHTTAWTIEVGAVQKMLEETGRNGLAARLAAETAAELRGDLMGRLAALLPADQLEGGQLSDVFDAAADVFAAATPQEAVKAYLSFRNLLPYATVDAGDRGGHSERRDAARSVVFDKASLHDAAVQKAGELDPARVKDTIATLAATAEGLELALEEDAADPAGAGAAPGWARDPRLEEPVRRTVERLRAEAERLLHGRPGDVAGTIMSVRAAEHDRVYDVANPT